MALNLPKNKRLSLTFAGSRRGEVIGDHIPPNKVVKDAVAAAAENDFFQALVTKVCVTVGGYPVCVQP